MNPPVSSRLDWFLFILLGFLWGSSYLFIKIGVDAGLQPFTLISLRLLIGLALLAVVVAVAREALPRGPQDLRPPCRDGLLQHRPARSC